MAEVDCLKRLVDYTLHHFFFNPDRGENRSTITVGTKTSHPFNNFSSGGMIRREGQLTLPLHWPQTNFHRPPQDSNEATQSTPWQKFMKQHSFFKTKRG